MVKAKVGMKVHVFSPDKSKDLGIGEIIRIENLDVENDDGSIERLSNNYPIIRLKNGKEIGGIECWWYPIRD